MSIAAGKTVLVIGTYDTKTDELVFVEEIINGLGAKVLALDVSILGETAHPVSITKHQVAEASGRTITEIIAFGEEALAMDAMAEGAVKIVRELVDNGRIHGVLALGGTMGTDLALDVYQELPLGLPKYLISTVAFSAAVPPERLATDVQMILWAGGLYGLNEICRATLAQAAGAVVGAAVTARPVKLLRPIIGVTSLGNTCLKYIRSLKPALEERGYDVAVFHSTGMGGRAFEALAEAGMFAAVLDLCLQEFSNGLFGSIVASGADRLRGAGRAGIPQIVAPGAVDLVDWPTWQELPAHWHDRPLHKHNKLISSLTLSGTERKMVAREMAWRLKEAKGAVHVIMPLDGVEAWDREGEMGYAPDDLASYYSALKAELGDDVPYSEVSCHINDGAFVDAVLAQFDRWCAEGVIEPPVAEAQRLAFG